MKKLKDWTIGTILFYIIMFKLTVFIVMVVIAFFVLFAAVLTGCTEACIKVDKVMFNDIGQGNIDADIPKLK